MRRAWRWLAAAALTATGLHSLGCEAVRRGANPEVPIWANRPSWSMDVTYRVKILAPSRAEGEPYERGRAELDVVNRRVYIGSSDHGMYALSAEDGSIHWRFETLGPVQCEALYDAGEDVVYFGSNDGALYKVRASDGKLLWRFMTNAEVAEQPVLDSGLLFVVNANDTLVALDPKTGKMRWHQHRPPALGMEVAGYAGPTLWRNKVYMGFSDGTVTAFDKMTGIESWQPVDLSAEAEQSLGDVPTYLDVDTTPVPGTIEAGPAVFVASYEGGVFALDADTGNQIWDNVAPTGVTELYLWEQPAHEQIEGPRVERRRRLIASSGTTGIWALDPETGRDIWHRGLPDGGVSAPVPILGALMVTTTLQGMYLLSPLDGGVIDGIHTGDAFNMPVAAYGTRAYAVTNNGYLLAVRLRPPH